MVVPLCKVNTSIGNWYIVDEDFSWDIRRVKHDIMSLIPNIDVPVIFCDTCDANDILLALGEEEEEFLIAMNGYYHQGKGIIFIFAWDTYEQLLGTLLHEIRHHMQFQKGEAQQLRHTHHVLPYETRWIEKDARNFAKKMMRQYAKKINQTY